jgi:signal peptidase II
MRRMAVWGQYSRLGFAAAVAAFAADRLHKWWMIDVYRIGERGTVEITSFFQLKLIKNHGISYGLLPQNSASGQIALVAVSIVAAVLLGVWLMRGSSRWIVVSLGLIIGGALANALDRALYGAVSDFFYFHPFETRLLIFDYVFNIADVAIVGGVAGLVVDALFLGQTTHQKPHET